MKKTALPIVASALVAPAIAQAYPTGPAGVCHGVAK